MSNAETVSVFDADARRRGLRQRSLSMGIDEAYVAELVDTFYRRVRAHSLLGPIFEQAIGEDWGPHLTRMKSFWASLTLYTGHYSGKPVPAHQKLNGVRPWHFDIWLALFRSTLEDTAPSPEAADFLMERAEKIAVSLKLAMFGAPGLPARSVPLETHQKAPTPGPPTVEPPDACG